MIRQHSLSFLTSLMLLVVVLSACGDSAGDATLAPATTDAVTTTTSTATATRLVDEWIGGLNNHDFDRMMSVFADDFSFKGICGFCSERTDIASMTSYAESLFPLQIQIERTSALAMTPDGAFTFTADVITVEDQHVAGIEFEIGQ